MDDGTRAAYRPVPWRPPPRIDPRADLGARRVVAPRAARRRLRRRAGEREPDAEQMSLGRRLRQPRTIISIAVPLVIIAVFVGSTASSSERSRR